MLSRAFRIFLFAKELQNQVKRQHVVGVGLVSQDALGPQLRKASLARMARICDCQGGRWFGRVECFSRMKIWLVYDLWWFMMVHDGYDSWWSVNGLAMVSTGLFAMVCPSAKQQRPQGRWHALAIQIENDRNLRSQYFLDPMAIALYIEMEPSSLPQKHLCHRQSCLGKARRNLSQVHWNSSTRDGYDARDQGQPKCNDKPTPACTAQSVRGRKSWKKVMNISSCLKCQMSGWEMKDTNISFVRHICFIDLHRFKCPHKFIPDSKFTASEVATDPVARL